MASLDLPSNDQHLEEDYIDMEISSYSNLFSKTTTSSSSSSPNNPREFEFQMSSTTRDQRDHPTTSPADELFYKGKLLPLHLPPRLQMVEKLLENPTIFSSSFHHQNLDFDNEFFGTPSLTTVQTPTATSTPFESCNVSPSESFRINKDLHVNIPDMYEDDMSSYMSQFSAQIFLNRDDDNNNKEENLVKKSLTKKLKHAALIGSKLKASRAYLRSFFGKSSCTDESSTAARKVADEGSAMRYVVKANHHNNNNNKSIHNKKKNIIPFGQIQTLPMKSMMIKKENINDVDNIIEGCDNRHRRSFSLALRRNSTTTKQSSSSSSSTSSSSSSGSSSFSSRSNYNSKNEEFNKHLKRSGSAKYSEKIECSLIQGAIAHCKQSQAQIFHSRNSISASRIGVCTEEQERHIQLCRG